jgi:hypothetical protein
MIPFVIYPLNFIKFSLTSIILYSYIIIIVQSFQTLSHIVISCDPILTINKQIQEIIQNLQENIIS